MVVAFRALNPGNMETFGGKKILRIWEVVG